MERAPAMVPLSDYNATARNETRPRSDAATDLKLELFLFGVFIQVFS